MTTVGLRPGVTLVSATETGVIYPNVQPVPLGREELPFSAVWSLANDDPADVTPGFRPAGTGVRRVP
jgi:hypothetical protein